MVWCSVLLFHRYARNASCRQKESLFALGEGPEEAEEANRPSRASVPEV